MALSTVYLLWVFATWLLGLATSALRVAGG